MFELLCKIVEEAILMVTTGRVFSASLWRLLLGGSRGKLTPTPRTTITSL